MSLLLMKIILELTLRGVSRSLTCELIERVTACRAQGNGPILQMKNDNTTRGLNCGCQEKLCNPVVLINMATQFQSIVHSVYPSSVPESFQRISYQTPVMKVHMIKAFTTRPRNLLHLCRRVSQMMMILVLLDPFLFLRNRKRAALSSLPPSLVVIIPQPSVQLRLPND